MTDRAPTVSPGVDALTEREKSVGKLVTDAALSGGENALLRLGVRTAGIALDRRGRDLEREDQRWDSFEAVVETTSRDVLDHFEDADAHVEGVDGLVFEGVVVDEDRLATEAVRLTELVEEGTGFERDSPGGLVEPVEDGDQA